MNWKNLLLEAKIFCEKKNHTYKFSDKASAIKCKTLNSISGNSVYKKILGLLYEKNNSYSFFFVPLNEKKSTGDCFEFKSIIVLDIDLSLINHRLFYLIAVSLWKF